ncbi:hypothetical protein SteCoe_9070 [Stentor coeruleus]|uniref:C3H1-type domain-containing protein n=1 Tax=Stentor coeruleus TaxID=5963 RepID=A0A1R2CIL4_9CILI|nr:hypothetical protein SteCoe_9070 [Stentor coeruleus]
MIKKDIRRIAQNGFSPETHKDVVLIRGEPETRFKTEMCRNWEAGNCEYGDKCFFAHGQKELRDKNGVRSIKDQKCENFFKFGYCLNGIKCQYSHTDDLGANYLSNQKTTNQNNFQEKISPPAFIDLESRNPYRS